MKLIMFGMPGIRIVRAITSNPTSESLANPAALGDHSTTGANTSQMPTKQAAQRLTGRSGFSARQPNTTSSTPEMTSDHVISQARSES